MAIEILGFPSRPINDNLEGTATLGGTAAQAAVSPAGGAPGDQFSLTTSAALLQELEKEIARLPIVDTGRVEQTQRALATGTFQVDPPHIADKLLELELIMNGRG